MSGKKYNVYIQKDNLETWESLPSYSKWVNEQLVTLKFKEPEIKPEPPTWTPPSSVTF
jgi:hypothetical protein